VRTKWAGRFTLGAIVLGMITMLTACGIAAKTEQQKESHKWSTAYVLTDVTNSKMCNEKCKKTVCDGISYLFSEEKFDKKSAEKAVENMAALIKYADSIFNKERCSDRIVFNVSIRNQTLITLDYKDYDNLWNAIRNIYKVNSAEQYGLLYIFSKERGLIREKNNTSKEKVASFFDDKKNLKFMDFCLPMLDTYYFADEQAQMTRQAARMFAEWYVETYSMEEYANVCREIKAVDRRKLEKIKNEWLQSIGCKAQYREFGKIFFCYEKHELPGNVVTGAKIDEPIYEYRIEEGDANWLWSTADVTEVGYDEMVRNYSLYEPLRKKDCREAREFLKDYMPKKLHSITIMTNFSDKESHIGAYYGSFDQTITVNYDWDTVSYGLIHEYCHYITMAQDCLIPPETYAVWAEWVAVWLADFELENRTAANERERIYDKDVKTLNYEEMQLAVERQWSRDKSRKPSKAGIPFAIDRTKLHYPEMGTIMKYIYETYGMEKVAELVKTDAEFERVLGLSLDELYFRTVDWAKEEIRNMEAEQGEK